MTQKKLDLNKPFRVRGNKDAKVRLVGRVEYSVSTQCLVFEVDTPGQWSMMRVDEYGMRYSGVATEWDILNTTPERWRNVWMRADGTGEPWVGHTYTSKEEAEKIAEEALARQPFQLLATIKIESEEE